MPAGFGAALTYNFDPRWGLELDFGHSLGNSNYEFTTSLGPRFMWRTEHADPFLHALVGYNRLSTNALGSSDGIGAIIGGGLDLPINKHIAFRVFEADYVFARHNFPNDADPEFPDLRRPRLQGVRLRTGVVLSWGGAPALIPAATCSVQPTEVIVGEPIMATVTTSSFNPKHTLTYSWSGNGGQVAGKETGATIDTNGATPGSFTVIAHVNDAAEKKNGETSCSANYTIKRLPSRNPPTLTLSASSTSTLSGPDVKFTAACISPDGAPVSVANWKSSAGTISSAGESATLNTAGLPPGSVTVNATCTDSRTLSAAAAAQITIENPPPPRIEPPNLHSVYFSEDKPRSPDIAGVPLPSQQQTLVDLARGFQGYVAVNPSARLTLEGHADARGDQSYNQGLSERRVAQVKSFLVEQGVPESSIDTKAYGAQHNLTDQEVKDSIEQNKNLTSEEQKRALANIRVIRLASNRRVDVTLSSAGQSESSVRQFPFNAEDAMSLIGGRESEKQANKPAAKGNDAVKK